MGRSAAPPIPFFERLEIESQANCNRSCWFCPRTYDRTGTYLDESGKATLAQMPTEKLLDLLDQAQGLGFTGLVTFHFFSEPLLDRRNPTLAAEARKRGMRPFLHTNGDPLRTNDALCEAVQDVYEFIVVGLYEYETAEALEETKAFWQTRLPRADLKFSYIRPVQAPGVPSLGIPRALVPTDSRMSIPDLTYANAPCNRPLLRLLIRYDGALCHCCEDIHAQFGLGNVFESSLEELWFSERHERIVRDLLDGERSKYALCRNCPLSPTGPVPGGGRVGLQRRSYVPGSSAAPRPGAR